MMLKWDFRQLKRPVDGSKQMHVRSRTDVSWRVMGCGIGKQPHQAEL